MIANTTTDSTGMVTTKTSAACQSTVKAMTIAPSTIKGERKKRRSTMLSPFCTRFMSLVSRVMRVVAPIRSSAPKERD